MTPFWSAGAVHGSARGSADGAAQTPGTVAAGLSISRRRSCASVVSLLNAPWLPPRRGYCVQILPNGKPGSRRPGSAPQPPVPRRL